jgi:hypothetical protein
MLVSFPLPGMRFRLLTKIIAQVARIVENGKKINWDLTGDKGDKETKMIKKQKES